MYDKSQRLEKLVEMIHFGQQSRVPLDDLKRAARLSKCDLVTGMVTEFTELQGVMGREYARLDGEKADVCEGIFEQYLPRFAGDRLPSAAAKRRPVPRIRSRCAVRLWALSISCWTARSIWTWPRLWGLPFCC